MSSKEALALFISGCLVLYVLGGVIASFVLWDFGYMWVGNWDGLGRLFYSIGVLVIAGSLHKQWMEE